MNIRPARNADREVIADIHTLSWQQTYRGVIPEELLHGPIPGIMADRWRGQDIRDCDVVLVAEDDDAAIAGFAATWLDDEAYIDNLHVRSSYQSQGLGRAMLRETVRALLSNGVNSAYLHVVASNDRARAFYLRLGGEPGPIEDKNLYGTVVPNQRIDWPDLSILAG